MSSLSTSPPSSPPSLVTIDYNTEHKYALVSFNHNPVNSFTSEMMNAIISAIDEIEKKQNMNAIIFTSGVSNIFSAGLDLKTLKTDSKEQIANFWSKLQELFLKIYGCTLFTCALINGQCFAGGCVFSLCCDYRIINSKYSIGLNESQFGLVAPWWFCKAYENVIGKRQCEMHIQLGTLHKASEALSIGLVDEVHEKVETMKESAINQVKKWNKVNQFSKRESKRMLRRELYEGLNSTRKEDVELSVSLIGSPSVQKLLAIYLQSLQKKSSSSSPPAAGAERSSKL